MQTVLRNEVASSLPAVKGSRGKFNLSLGLKRTAHALNDYFGLESLSDLLWFYGFISLCGVIGLSLTVINLLG